MAALFASQRGVRPTNTASRAARVARPRPVSAPACRRRNGTVAVRAFFNFLAPKTAAPVADPRRDELAEELVSICEPTDAGSKAAPAVKEQIEELVRAKGVMCGGGMKGGGGRGRAARGDGRRGGPDV